MAAASGRRTRSSNSDTSVEHGISNQDSPNSDVSKSQKMFLEMFFSDEYFTSLYDLKPTLGSSDVLDSLRPILERMREADKVRLDGTPWTAAEDMEVCREFLEWARSDAGTGNKYTMQVGFAGI